MNRISAIFRQIFDFRLLILPMEATCITERSATLTDYPFANTYAMNAVSGNLVSQISDHLPQFLIVNHRNDNLCF